MWESAGKYPSLIFFIRSGSPSQFGYIHKTLLPHRSVKEIVQYFHLWKTTPDYELYKLNRTPLSNRQRSRRMQHLEPTSINSRKAAEESTDEEDEDNSPGGSDATTDGTKRECFSRMDFFIRTVNQDGDARHCHHCGTTESQAWHHGGPHAELLCRPCRQCVFVKQTRRQQFIVFTTAPFFPFFQILQAQRLAAADRLAAGLAEASGRGAERAAAECQAAAWRGGLQPAAEG